MLRRNLALTLTSLCLINIAQANDFGIYMPGDSNIEDTLGNKESVYDSHIMGGQIEDYYGNQSAIIEEKIIEKELTPRQKLKRELTDLNVTVQGQGLQNSTYGQIDKKNYVNKIRSSSASALNIHFLANLYDYSSTNNIIENTISSGRHSNKGGTVIFKYDKYLSQQQFLSTFWSGSMGIGLSTGKGIFSSDGKRSDATFNLWQAPVEVGLGIEIPISSYFKLSASGGGGILGLYQNRNDFERGEDNKRRIQFSPGFYGLGQLKINLTGFSDQWAYDVFTQSNLTNILLNLDVRFQHYGSFKDEELAISGVTFGAGFTFEFL